MCKTTWSASRCLLIFNVTVSVQYASAQTVAGTGALRVMGGFLVSIKSYRCSFIFTFICQKKFYPYSKTIYLSDHTWPNHPQIFRYSFLCHTINIRTIYYRDAGLDIKYYHYYDPKTCGFNAEAAYADLKVYTCLYRTSFILSHHFQSIPEHSIVLFQACGHNPTGVDPNVQSYHCCYDVTMLA